MSHQFDESLVIHWWWVNGIHILIQAKKYLHQVRTIYVCMYVSMYVCKYVMTNL